jgi:hypothetical protein
MKSFLLIPLIAIILFASCATEPGNIAPFGSVNIEVRHFIEQKPLTFDTTNGHVFPPAQLMPLVFDTAIYRNAYGEQFSVTRLQYYISNICFYNGNRIVYNSGDKVFYIDARNPVYHLQLDGVPMGNYSSVSYEIGLDAGKNWQGFLPNNLDNKDMEWPASIGGGYHFMKMEGYWKNATTQKTEIGYAMHLGDNQSLVWGISYPIGMIIQAGMTNNLLFRMNVSQWWKSPHTYSLDVNGNYTMGNDTLMAMIRDNGIDVFDIFQEE